MNENLLFELMQTHIEQESADLVGQGWEFDTLVFWDRVTDIQRRDSLSLRDAYDKAASKHSFLLTSSQLISAHEAFSAHAFEDEY